MDKPQVTYDPRAKAIYVTITRTPVARTVPAKGDILADYDADGKLVGVEVVLFEETLEGAE